MVSDGLYDKILNGCEAYLFCTVNIKHYVYNYDELDVFWDDIVMDFTAS